MKICILCLATKGGMIQYASRLSSSISKDNEVYVILPDNFEGKFDKKINLIKVRVPVSYFSRDIFNFYLILKLIKSLDPDIIHITALNPLLLLLLPFLRKYPIITTIHDVKLHFGEWSYIWNISLEMSKKFSDKILVHGKWAMITLSNEGIPKNKIEILNLGNLINFGNDKSNNLKETNSILFFGRIEDYKGLEYLIKSEPLISKEIDNLKIIIAGEGNFNKYNDIIINKDNFDIYNTFIPEEKIPFFFHQCKLVVLPYIECTQTGIVPIAYNFKKPVVVSDVGCIPEIVINNHTGIIVPKKDPEALAKAIIKILTNDNLGKKMGYNGYVKMEREMSWDIVAKKLNQIYFQIVSNSKQ